VNRSPHKQRAGAFLHHEAAFPSVRQVRCIEPAHGVLAKCHRFVVGQGARWAIGQVANRHQCRDRAAQRRRVRRGGQPLIERSALVGFDVREGDMPQLRHRHHRLHRLEYQREQLPQPGVEQQRFVVVDQVLVERETHIAGNDTGVLMRYRRSAISWTLVPDCVLVTGMVACVLEEVPVRTRDGSAGGRAASSAWRKPHVPNVQLPLPVVRASLQLPFQPRQEGTGHVGHQAQHTSAVDRRDAGVAGRASPPSPPMATRVR
jgi:hypothetical protein